MRKTRLLSLLSLLMMAVTGVWAGDTVFELNGSEASVGTLTLGTTGITASTVKIHNNTDEIAAIKMGNDYVYADGKYFTIAPKTGSFKKGDKVSIAICYNKDGAADYAKAKIFAADHETLLYTTADGINGRTSVDDPVVEEYVLTADADYLIIGRYAKTATYVTTLKVVRESSSTYAVKMAAPTDAEAENWTIASGENSVKGNVADGLTGLNKDDQVTITYTGTKKVLGVKPDAIVWNAETKTGTLTMPSSDVELTPEYAPTAAWKTDGDKILIPEAAEGVIAGTDEFIVTPGVVAEVNDVPQGIVMYYATTDATFTKANAEALAADAWLAVTPTAEDYDDAATVYVWYYIWGADTPDGEVATAENTFNDSEICSTPITVNVLSNKFTLTLSPAPVEKVSVKVGGTAVTPGEDGKVENVKMDTEVKLNANQGYKIRRVTVSKTKPAND